MRKTIPVRVNGHILVTLARVILIEIGIHRVLLSRYISFRDSAAGGERRNSGNYKGEEGLAVRKRVVRENAMGE